jgi:hypothetical protein
VNDEVMIGSRFYQEIDNKITGRLQICTKATNNLILYNILPAEYKAFSEQNL